MRVPRHIDGDQFYLRPARFGMHDFLGDQHLGGYVVDAPSIREARTDEAPEARSDFRGRETIMAANIFYSDKIFVGPDAGQHEGGTIGRRAGVADWTKREKLVSASGETSMATVEEPHARPGPLAAIIVSCGSMCPPRREPSASVQTPWTWTNGAPSRQPKVALAISTLVSPEGLLAGLK